VPVQAALVEFIATGADLPPSAFAPSPASRKSGLFSHRSFAPHWCTSHSLPSPLGTQVWMSAREMHSLSPTRHSSPQPAGAALATAMNAAHLPYNEIRIARTLVENPNTEG
jgi:hypothetical protein